MLILDNIDRVALWFITRITRSEKKQIALHQFFKFACIGAVNTVIDVMLFYVLTHHTSFFDPETPFLFVANIISYMTAATLSFFSNRLWTFRLRSSPTMSEATKFYGTNISGLIINSGILGICARVLGINELGAKGIATVFTIFWNFILQKFWVFRVSKK